jgi:hypothetical protein
MLDDLYKTVVVLITEHYVKDPTILPAASASKALFAEMKKKGWHEVRLLGLTDKLFNPDNKPSDAFEQRPRRSCLRARRAMKRSSRERWKALPARRNRDTRGHGAMYDVPSDLEGEQRKHWGAILHDTRD